LTLSVPDQGYFRNVSCALNLVSTNLLLSTPIYFRIVLFYSRFTSQ